jgi:hypothetical protein
MHLHLFFLDSSSGVDWAAAAGRLHMLTCIIQSFYEAHLVAGTGLLLLGGSLKTAGRRVDVVIFRTPSDQLALCLLPPGLVFARQKLEE